MDKSLFYRFGHIVYRWRFAIIGVWLIAFFGSIPLLSKIMYSFQTTGFVAESSESAQTNAFLDKHLSGYQHQIMILYHSDKISTENPKYLKKIQKSLAKLEDFPIKHTIIYPSTANHQISKDHKTAYVIIFFKNIQLLNHAQLQQFKHSIQTPKHMEVLFGGNDVFVDAINQQTEKDLYKADKFALPLSIIVFILVFGSLIAAIMPLLLGGGCALVILMGLYGLSQVLHLSVFTLNIALLLGLCLSLDYALFIISRFREELHQHKTIEETICITLATAGKAIFFSGLAVFISLSALLIFPINILFSMGVGGLTSVFVAVSLAMTLLPACLCILKSKINALSIYSNQTTHTNPQTSIWGKLATIVVQHRLFFFCTPLVLLLILSYPFLHVATGLSDYHVLADHSKARRFFDVYQDNFNAQTLNPIIILVTSQHNTILTPKHIRAIYKLTQKLKNNTNVFRVDSITSVIPNAKAAQYVQLYQSLKQYPNPEIKQLLNLTSGKKFTVITLSSRYGIHSVKTQKLIQQLRQLNLGSGLNTHLTGMPVIHADVLKTVTQCFPYALIWIITLTYLILLCLLRSILLPIKAICMTLLSLCASYGILVFVFQDGYLQNWLHFEAQGIVDLNLLIIIFCALFGFSMDYEVFLLTRMHEHYLKTHDSQQSIIYGITKSSRIITSAALIVIVLCGSFMVANVLMVKAFGLGIAVAIFVDAFIIRTLLVPSIMAFLKNWSWYYPQRKRKRLKT